MKKLCISIGSVNYACDQVDAVTLLAIVGRMKKLERATTTAGPYRIAAVQEPLFDTISIVDVEEES